MRILMLNHHITWRGAFTRCYQLARRLGQFGCQVTIVTISPAQRLRSRRFELEGIEVIETPDLLWGPLRSGWDPWDIAYRSWWLRHQRQYQVIHAFDNRPAVILPILLSRRPNGGALVSDWGDWWGRGGVIRERPHKVLNRILEPLETFFEEHFRHRAKALVTVSELLRERAIALGIPPERIRVIANGCDTEAIPSMDKAQARGRLGLPQNAKVIAFSGFTSYEFDFLLRSFKEVCGRVPDAILLVTGHKFLKGRGTPDFPNRGRVLETGMVPREDLGLYLSGADVCVLPFKDTLANRARSPGKLWDYLAAGRPIVSNDVGEAGALLSRDKVGLVARYDPQDFGGKILSLLTNPEMCAEMGQRARNLAETKYAWSVKTRELFSLYQSLVA
jgi:glycosyltransferase involved in cell wall biosynthesis